LMLFVCIIFSIIYDNYYLRKTNNMKKYLSYLMYISIFLLIIALMLYFDLFGIYSLFDNFYIIDKLRQGFDNNRLKIFVEALKLAPSHLWGKQEISKIIGIEIHDLFFDTFDYAGIVPCLLLITYTIMLLENIKKLHLLKNQYNVLFMSVFLAITIQMFLEPMMTGGSLFVIAVIIIGTLYEGLVLNAKK